MVGKKVQRVSQLESNPPEQDMSGVSHVSKRIIPIVSFDGGGTRGVYSLELAVRLEDALREKLQQPNLKLVDAVKYVAGTSVGGIIALAMAKGYSMHEISDQFNKHIPEIFSKSVRSEIDYVIGNKPRYSREKLDVLAKELFNGGQAKDAIVPFAVTSSELNKKSATRIITREHMQTGFFKDTTFEDLVNMTSAAPTYFAPYKYRGEFFTDGGVSINNPAVEAWIEARNYYGPDNDFVMCSFGTGITPTPLNQDPDKDAYGWGWMTWVDHENILSAVLNGSSTATENAMHRLYKSANGKGNYRMQTIMDEAIALDTTDPKLLEQMRADARAWIANNQAKWNEMVHMVAAAWTANKSQA